MTPTDEKLKIALEALLKIGKVYTFDDGETARRTAREALRKIQRDHYLSTPSPAVAEVIGAGRI